MSTVATTMEKNLASAWEKIYGSAVLSGIVGDLAHKERGGYHISRQDQGTSNYSVVRADDKPGNGPSDTASAIDMTMSTADIIKCHTRLRDIWKNRAKDSRMKYINAWNGWDGTGDAGRYDAVTGNVETASADHKWHIHLEIRRKYVNDATAQKAILSMLSGQSLAAFNGVASTNGDDDDMTKDEMLALLKSAEGKEAIAVAVLTYDPGVDATTKKIKAGGIENLGVDAPTNPTVQVAYALRDGEVNKKLGYEIRDKTIPALQATILAALGKTNVDSAAIAAALVNNTAFVDGLSSALAAKLPEVNEADLADALKTVLRDGVTSA